MPHFDGLAALIEKAGVTIEFAEDDDALMSAFTKGLKPRSLSRRQNLRSASQVGAQASAGGYPKRRTRKTVTYDSARLRTND